MAKRKPHADNPGSRRGRQKGEQQHLPEMEPKKIPRIHNLALSYVRMRDERMDLTKQETEAKALVVAAMQDEGIAEYLWDDVQVQLTTTLELKVGKSK